MTRETLPHPEDYDVVLLDIEGTTTSISFVYDTLFPFAKEALDAFLKNHGSDPEVMAIAEQIERDTQELRQQGLDAPLLDPSNIETVIENVRWQMEHDQKTTGLKALQGHIWKGGYLNGSLQGHVFEDTPVVLNALHERDTPAYIYSSGSIAAQKLLFGYSTHGDLLPLLQGHFDTTTGPKKVASSYESIAASIAVPVDRVVFLTDNLLEAEAADQAGMKTVLLYRPGNPETTREHPYPTARDLLFLIPNEA